MPIEREEWLRRYAARFVAVAGVSPEFAEQCARAESFEMLSEWEPDDPEAAADMEMSYWEP